MFFLWKDKIKQYIPSSVSTLAAGNAISHTINLAGIPLLTHLFTPAAFASLALFASIGNIVLAYSTLKYEFSIIIAGKLTQKLGFTRLSISTNLILSIASSLLLAAALYFEIIRLSDAPTFLFFFVLSCYFVLNGTLQSLIYFSIGLKKYQPVSFARIGLALGFVLFSIILKFSNISLILPIAFTLSYLISVIAILKAVNKYLPILIRGHSNLKFSELTRQHRGLQYYFLPGSMVEIITAQLIIIILYQYFPITIAGTFFIALKIINVPSVIIGQAFGYVFFQEAAEKNRNKELTMETFYLIWRQLLLLGFFPFLLLYFFGKPLFSFLLGPAWGIAGEMASWLAIYGLFKFISSPTSSGLLVLNQEKFNLIIAIARLFITMAGLITAIISYDFFFFLKYFVVAEIILISSFNYLMARKIQALEKSSYPI